MRKFWPLLLVCTAPAQIWEKPIAPGLTYRAELDLKVPRMVHALRFSPKVGGLEAKPELGQGKIYEDDPTKGRETITAMAVRTRAVAAINADFFPFTGDPLGLMVRDGELLSLPYPNRSAFAWGEGGGFQAVAEYTGMATPDLGLPFPIKGVNQEAGVNELTLNFPIAGAAICRQANRLYAVVRLETDDVKPIGRVIGEVQYLLEGTESVPIQAGNAILAASGTRVPDLRALNPGQRITFDLAVTGFDWKKVRQAVGGGPTLISRGRSAIRANAEGFNDAFSEKRHPRTAVGLTANGDLWFVTIDGRQKISDGATLAETAQVLRGLGCTEAINLDGGGSTTLNVLGLTLNRVSEGQERAVANGVVWLRSSETVPTKDLMVEAPTTLFVGDELTLKVKRPTGEPLANADVLWTAKGKGWIDQGGRVRATESGLITVTAIARGQWLQHEITVAERPKPR